MSTQQGLPSDLTTIRAYANRLGVSYDTMRLWCWYHKVPVALRIGRNSIYRVKDLEPYRPRKDS